MQTAKLKIVPKDDREEILHVVPEPEPKILTVRERFQERQKGMPYVEYCGRARKSVLRAVNERIADAISKRDEGQDVYFRTEIERPKRENKKLPEKTSGRINPATPSKTIEAIRNLLRASRSAKVYIEIR